MPGGWKKKKDKDKKNRNKNKNKNKDKKKKKKGSKNNSSESTQSSSVTNSSTPSCSTPSIDDDKQQLVKGAEGGACGSSEIRKSRSHARTKSERSSGSKSREVPYQLLGTTSHKNVTPDHSPRKDRLVPENANQGQSSPSKRIPVNRFRLSPRSRSQIPSAAESPKKKSPNRNIDTECRCEDETRHVPENQEQKLLETGVKVKLKSSGSVLPLLSREAEDYAHLSNVSCPGADDACQSELLPGRDYLAVPDPDGNLAPSSPSKGSFLSRQFMKISPKRKSPNRSTSAVCSCEDKNNHVPECPKLNKQESDEKGKSSKTSSSSVSPVSSRKEGTQSSSSSDPSAKEGTEYTFQSKFPSKKNYLTVPDVESDRPGPSSPSKKAGVISKALRKFSPNRRSPTVNLDCSCANKNIHEPDCPKRVETKGKSPNISETSSSSVSPVISKKKKDSSDSGNVASLSSWTSSSKSTSSSDPNAKHYLHPGRSGDTSESSSGNRSPNKSMGSSPSKRSPNKSKLRSHSGNQTDYDAGEGTSSGSTAGRHAYHLRNLGSDVRLSRKDPKTGEEEYLLLIDGMSENEGEVSENESLEEEENGESKLLKRRKSGSCENLYIYEWIPKPKWFQRIKRRYATPSPPRITKEELQMQKRSEKRSAKEPARNVDSGTNSDSSELLRNVESGPNQTNRRHVSNTRVHLLARCTCPRSESAPYNYFHELGCPLMNNMRRRKKKKRCRQSVPKPPKKDE